MWDVAVYGSLLFFVLGTDDTHIGMCDLKGNNAYRENHHVSRIRIPDAVPSSVQFPRHARFTGTGQPLIHIHTRLRPPDAHRITGMAVLAVTVRFSNDGPPTIEWLESVGPQPYGVELFDLRRWRPIILDPHDIHQIDVLEYVAGHVWSVVMLSKFLSSTYALVLSHANADGIICHRRIEIHDSDLARVTVLGGMTRRKLLHLLFDEASGRLFVCIATVGRLGEDRQSSKISIYVLEF